MVPIAEPSALAADPAVPAACRILAVRRESHDTFTLEIDPSPLPGFAFRPGQFDMLWAFGAGEVPVSISGDPGVKDRLVHTIRVVGGVTRALERLRRGDTVGVRGPYGEPWPVDRAEGRDLVIVAGGIGLAPLRPVLHAVARRRSLFGRVTLMYGARTPADVLFRRDLDRWKADARIEVLVTVDRATAVWPGDVGVVTKLLPRARFEPAEAIAMLCGPEVMMRFATVDLLRRGVLPENVVVSLERNMKCGIGVCGHCQLGPILICRDGPVFEFARVRSLIEVRDL